MVSPELLRRYPFFASLTENQIQAIAMLGQEKQYGQGAILIQEETPAETLMLLLDGDVDLIYSGGGEGAVVNALVGSVAAGEILGVSSLIPPYRYICSARNNVPVRVVEFDARRLREMMEEDSRLGYVLMANTAAAVLERLKYTQVELAAARA